MEEDGLLMVPLCDAGQGVGHWPPVDVNLEGGMMEIRKERIKTRV